MTSSFFDDFSTFIHSIGLSESELIINSNQNYTFPKKKLSIILHANTLQTKIVSYYSNTSVKQIHIYEFQWCNSQEILKSRIRNLLGLNQKLAARNCTISPLNKLAYDEFLNQNHLLGSVKGGYALGLIYKEEPVAVILFSKARTMTDSATYYRSYELLRFATIKNHSITGGFRRLLSHFIQLKSVVHIMTYIDLDWGEGDSYLQCGFEKISKTEPIAFYVSPKTNERIWETPFLADPKPGFIKLQNQGSLKLTLDLRQQKLKNKIANFSNSLPVNRN